MVEQLTTKVVPFTALLNLLEVVEIGKKAVALSYVDATEIQVMFTSFLTERCTITSRNW